MKKYQSIARWPSCLNFQDNTTTDEHETKEGAENVCWMLKKWGLGAEMVHFPIHTEIKPL